MPLLVFATALSWLRVYVEEVWNRIGIRSILFAAQRKAIGSKKRFKAVLCPRRSGKTYMVLVDIFNDHRKNPGADYCYIALNKDAGSRIVWKTIAKLNEQFSLGMKPVESKHLWRFPNGCTLYVLGADKPGWEESFRGLGSDLRRVVIDECKSYSIDLWHFILDAVRPALVDHLGTLWCIGTPGEEPIGFWWDVTRPDEDERNQMFELHNWDVFDNPYVAKEMAIEIEELKEAFGDDYVNTPRFQREYKGRWVVDMTDKVYTFDWSRNVVNAYPREINGEGEHYVLALDFGHSDAYAESLHGYSDFDDTHYVLESWKRGTHNKLGKWKGEPVLLDEVVVRVQGGVNPRTGEHVTGYAERYVDLIVVADNASPLLIDELESRLGLTVDYADKTDKKGAIQVMNTMMKAEKWKVVREPGTDNPLVEELTVLKKHWKNKAEWIENSAQSNDCCDTNLYGYRRSGHHDGAEREADGPGYGSPEWLLEEAQRMKERRLAGADRDRSYS